MFKNYKKSILLLIVIIIVIIIIIGLIITEQKKNLINHPITQEEYKKYDKYGFEYDNDESTVFYLLKDLMDNNDFNLVLKTDNSDLYTTTNQEDWNMVKKKLQNCKEIREICYETGFYMRKEIESYSVEYLDKSNDTIRLTYYSDGLVKKSIYYSSSEKLVLVTNKLRKDIYYISKNIKNRLN